jgi:hypothetical protein
VTQVFRLVCDVPGRDWPDPTVIRTNPVTGQEYPTPFFDRKVSDRQNGNIVRAVAQQVMSDLDVSFPFIWLAHTTFMNDFSEPKQ